MSLIKETGAGVENANTYASIEDANKYLIYSSNWNTALLEDKIMSLKIASLVLDNNFHFYGKKKDEESFLEFPRTGFFNYYTGVFYISTIPSDIVKATCVVANDLLTRDVVGESEEATPIRRIQITGMMEVELGGLGSVGNKAYPINKQALRILAPYGVLKTCRL